MWMKLNQIISGARATCSIETVCRLWFWFSWSADVPLLPPRTSTNSTPRTVTTASVTVTTASVTPSDLSTAAHTPPLTSHPPKDPRGTGNVFSVVRSAWCCRCCCCCCWCLYHMRSNPQWECFYLKVTSSMLSILQPLLLLLQAPPPKPPTPMKGRLLLQSARPTPLWLLPLKVGLFSLHALTHAYTHTHWSGWLRYKTVI